MWQCCYSIFFVRCENGEEIDGEDSSEDNGENDDGDIFDVSQILLYIYIYIYILIIYRFDYIYTFQL